MNAHLTDVQIRSMSLAELERWAREAPTDAGFYARRERFSRILRRANADTLHDLMEDNTPAPLMTEEGRRWQDEHIAALTA